MIRKRSLGLIIWACFTVIAVSIIFSPITNLDFNHSILYSQEDNPQSSKADYTFLRWKTEWGRSNIDYAEDVWANQYYIYVCGTVDVNTTTPKLMLTRYSEWGWGWQDWNVTWTDGNEIHGNAVWGDSTYIYTAGTSVDNLYLIKWDNGGTQIWNTTWNLSGNFGNVSSLWGIEESIYLSGLYMDDLLLVKWDNSGNQIWNQTWGDSGWEEGFDVWGFENYIYTCGSTSSYGSGLNDSLIIKWDSDGNQIWNLTWGYSSDEYFTSIFGSNTSLYVTGNIWNENHTSTDVIIMNWNSEGILQWVQTWGGSEDERAYSIWANEFYVFVSCTTLSWGLNYEHLVMLKWNYAGVYVDSSWPYWDYDHQYIGKSIFGFNDNIYICGWDNDNQDNPGNYDQFLYQFSSYSSPPSPEFYLIKPNPSLNGTFTLRWQTIVESETYNLYLDTIPILDLTNRTPYLTLTNTSIIETGKSEATYFYYVTCVMKGTESHISNPGIVEVDLPDSPDKIPGYNVILILTVLSFTSMWVYKRKHRKN